MKTTIITGIIIHCLFVLTNITYSSQNNIQNLNHAEDWRGLHDAGEIKQENDVISFESTGSDPYILSSLLEFSADEFHAIEIDMSVTKGSLAQIFWTTKRSPHADEIKSKRFKILSDGQMHRYTVSLAGHPAWKGEIDRLRFDPCDADAKIKIRSFKIIDYLGPNVKVVQFHPNKPFIQVHEEFTLSALVRNTGDVNGAIQLEIQLPGQCVSLLDTSNEKHIQLEPGQETHVQWKLRGLQECAENVVCSWKKNYQTKENDGGEKTTLIQIVDIGNPKASMSLQDSFCRIDFLKTTIGFGPTRFQLLKDERWKTMAWMARLGTVKIRFKDGSIQTCPILADTAEHSHGEYIFQHSWKNKDEKSWCFELIVRPISSLEGAYQFTHRLSGEGGDLVYFSGPELFVGERAFGTKKDMAIFPGLEYLDQEAVSSSHAAAHPPVRDQYIPHPFKVTVPLMALSYDEMLISLLWPPHYSWSRNEKDLSPKFAVPNRLYDQNNHLFSLFVPPVPEYTHENQDMAFQPYRMEPGETIEIESVVYLTAGYDPMKVLDAWLHIYNRGELPQPESPRSYQEEIKLSRKAYLSTCWDEEAKGWGHCAGWNPVPSGGMLALLSLDHFLSDDEEVKEILQKRIQIVKEKILEKYGPPFLGEAVGCHVMTYEPAFHWGVTEKKLPEWKQLAINLENRQNPDGSWGFNPGRENQKALGDEGEVVSGTISPKAMALMRLARITAEPVATRTGLKALEALNTRTVPRGAQGWECPLAAADIMVSGQAARANLDAYHITGDVEYLEKAVYWARTGIAFHYLWNLPDRPLQRYATIPIFGATFYSHSWRGVPVQWCGLVYAYALQELAKFDASLPWDIVARGIVNSAMYQQLTEGEYVGTLPDSYGDYFQTARGAYINPENIMTNLHALEGNSLNIRTVFVDNPKPDALRISANADIRLEEKGNEKICLSVHSKEERGTEILIAPLTEKPKSVELQERKSMSMREELFKKDFGWRFMDEFQTLLIHVKHESEDMEIVVRR